MDVRVKLLLQGGHTWEFSCDDADPVLFGLMAALPGASVNNHLKPDSLIQVNARTGERLFLTPASLVSVNLVPLDDESPVTDSKRLVTTSPSILSQSTPATFAMVPSALPDDMHRALIRHALAQTESGHEQGQGGVRELNLSPMEDAVAQVFRSHVEQSRAKFGMANSALAGIRCGLYAIGDGKATSWERDADESLCLIYQFHAQPKGFTGGGIRLFDCRIENGGNRAADSFRDIEIDDNSLLIFPSEVFSAGLPVFCATRASADGLFLLRASLRVEPARD